MFYHHFEYEDTLYLFLDNKYEFAKELGSSKDKDLTLKEKIVDYLKKRKIKFNGNKIALVIGGVVISVMLITNTIKAEEYDYSDFQFSYITDIAKENINTNNNLTEEINDLIVENNDDVIENITKNTNVNTHFNTKSNNNATNNTTETIPNTVTQNKEEISITIRRSSGKYETYTMTDYLIGVIGAEYPASFNIEALKAGAIASRTYALKSINRGVILTDNTSTQAFKDINQLKALWGADFNKYYTKIKEAVEYTDRLVLTYNGELIEAMFHSTSNGKTESSLAVFGNHYPYLVSVDSYDTNASTFERTSIKSLVEVSRIMGFEINENTNIEVISRTSSGRISEIKIGDAVFKGTDFRNMLGIRSTDFDLSYSNGNLVIVTKGYGHGVGMSQYGANEMAKLGYSYSNILKHYYQGISIVKR